MIVNHRYSFSELQFRRGRAMIALFSIAIGIALFLSLQAYSEGYHQAARAPLTEIGADMIAQREGDIPENFEGIVFPHSTAPIFKDEMNEIKQMDGVEQIGEALFFWAFEEEQFLVGLGIDPANSLGPGRLRTAVREGRFLKAADTGVVVADSSYAIQNKLDIGDDIEISGHVFEIVGLVDTSRVGNIANANIYFPLNDVNELVKQADNVNSVYELEDRVRNLAFVKTDSLKAAQVSEKIKGLLGEKTLVTTPKSFEDVLGTTFVLIDRFGLLVGFACLFIALLSLIRVVITGLAERKRDVSIMRAVGWRKVEVIRQLTYETLIVVILGWIVGILISLGVIRVLSFFKVSVPVPWELSPTPHFMPGGSEELSISVALQSNLNMTWAAITFVLTVTISWFFSWQQARSLANLKSAEVLRSE